MNENELLKFDYELLPQEILNKLLWNNGKPIIHSFEHMFDWTDEGEKMYPFPELY
jgi:hypothetical protein